MKKIYFCIFIILIFFMSYVQKSESIDVNDNKQKSESIKLNHYRIKANLNVERKVLEGSEMITYVNNEDISLSEIYFYLYPNAFKKYESVPIYGDKNRMYPDGFNTGYIEIRNLRVEGEKREVIFEGAKETILKIILDQPLSPQQTIQISMEFKIKIPHVLEKFGYGKDTINFGNWYPIAAVYDDQGWNLENYYSIGDSFYSDVSDYEVEISVPSNYLVASTGSIDSEVIKDDIHIYYLKESNIRDFTWVAGDKFEVDEVTIDNILVKIFYFGKHKNVKDRLINIIRDAIKIYNEQFGKYPYSTYTVVETNYPSGMEFPGIVFIPETIFTKDKLLESIVIHETAHQWWCVTVGNNQVNEAWLDEGLAHYSELIYYEHKYGTDRAKNAFYSSEARYYQRKNPENESEIIVKPVYEFRNWAEYAGLVCNKTAMMLQSLRAEVQDEQFYQILKSYYQKYKFKNATTNDFIKTVEEVTNKSWKSFFEKWLYDKSD